MSIAAHIKQSLELPSTVVRMYLEDLTDADLLVRPHPAMNHIAWQLGHLISSEHSHVEHVSPGAMPALPSGFAARHTKMTAASDDASDFLTKVEYLATWQQQRTGSLTVLDGLTDEQLAEPAPEAIEYMGPTVGAVFAGEAVHWMMHAGQWAVIRRALGKPPLF